MPEQDLMDLIYKVRRKRRIKRLADFPNNYKIFITILYRRRTESAKASFNSYLNDINIELQFRVYMSLHMLQFQKYCTHFECNRK
jgi:hypothetical protein